MAECKGCVKNVNCVERRFFGGNQKNCDKFIDLNKYVEVVRCKDCKHWSMGYCNHFAYYSYEPMTNEYDFCSYGERRDGE